MVRFIAIPNPLSKVKNMDTYNCGSSRDSGIHHVSV